MSPALISKFIVNASSLYINHQQEKVRDLCAFVSWHFFVVTDYVSRSRILALRGLCFYLCRNSCHHNSFTNCGRLISCLLFWMWVFKIIRTKKDVEDIVLCELHLQSVNEMQNYSWSWTSTNRQSWHRDNARVWSTASVNELQVASQISGCAKGSECLVLKTSTGFRRTGIIHADCCPYCAVGETEIVRVDARVSLELIVCTRVDATARVDLIECATHRLSRVRSDRPFIKDLTIDVFFISGLPSLVKSSLVWPIVWLGLVWSTPAEAVLLNWKNASLYAIAGWHTLGYKLPQRWPRRTSALARGLTGLDWNKNDNQLEPFELDPAKKCKSWTSMCQIDLRNTPSDIHCSQSWISVDGGSSRNSLIVDRM